MKFLSKRDNVEITVTKDTSITQIHSHPDVKATNILSYRIQKINFNTALRFGPVLRLILNPFLKIYSKQTKRMITAKQKYKY